MTLPSNPAPVFKHHQLNNYTECTFEKNKKAVEVLRTINQEQKTAIFYLKDNIDPRVCVCKTRGVVSNSIFIM